MKILVVGGGGREHALVWKLAGETGVTEVLCAPGNPGLARLARCITADPGDPVSILGVATHERVDFTVVGPEVPLSRGLVDLLTSNGRRIFGPTQAAAALESSKAFAKDFMARHGIPTARFVTCASAADALNLIERNEFGFPVVLKADGLAAGKGVIIASDRRTAESAIRSMMVERRFGASGERVVVEEFLVGQEASYFVLADGERCVPFSSAQDHKRIFDDDQGPNTGGMGAFAPSPLISGPMEARILDEIVRPLLAGMAAEGTPYRGVLYVGLMISPDGPRVIEFNVRFGDPEAQVLLPMLDEGLAPLLEAASRGALPDRAARFRPEPHVGVVLAAAGYPDEPRTGDPISGLDAAAGVRGALVFHAGTRRDGDRVITAGGRVLNVVGRGASYRDAIGVAYRAAGEIHFEGMQFRRDIGRKAVVA